jgi:hypothetical protein
MIQLPEGFIPLIVIGEIDEEIHVFTVLTNDESCDLLEGALESIQDLSYEETTFTLQ